MPKKDETEKARLRRYIVDLAESIAESDELKRRDGKEPTVAALTEAARVLCQIYALLERTGDFDEGGSALNDYKQQFGNPGGGGRTARRAVRI